MFPISFNMKLRFTKSDAMYLAFGRRVFKNGPSKIWLQVILRLSGTYFLKLTKMYNS